MTSVVAAPTTAETEEPTLEAIHQALRDMDFPGCDGEPPPDGFIERVSVCDRRVLVHLALQLPGAAELLATELAVQHRLRALGATEARVVIRRPARERTPAAAGARDPWAGPVHLPTVGHVIAVGAGKGGVGKSTIAVNLALALANDGLRVGLLDADIYGPSIPILLGIEDGAVRARMTPERYIVPLEAHGLSLISFGFFLGERSPAIWRGPMVSKAVKQFARGVAWPALDVLVVDLPPGTGDIPLSLAQAIELSGAVVVTQSARVATAEARKAARMFTTLGVPLLGVVENMSGPFGRGGGVSVCDDVGATFLGEIAFDAEIVCEGDAGTPTVTARPNSQAARSFDHIAERVAHQLGWRRSVAPT